VVGDDARVGRGAGVPPGFLAPCAIGGLFVLLFAVTLKDRRLARADKPQWSLQEFAGTFYVNRRKSRDFSWAFASRFMFVLAYAFLTTYQAYYLLDKIGTAKADVPQQIFLGTLAQATVIIAASLIGGKLSDWTGRRKIFVLTASIVYGLRLEQGGRHRPPPHDAQAFKLCGCNVRVRCLARPATCWRA
jgi:Na+/melibiose symporter-like transporter